MTRVMNDTLATLNWLVEAGADEAVTDQPVNRLVAKPAAPAPAAMRVPSPMAAPKPATPRPAQPAPPPLDGDAIGGAQAAAGASTNLAELKAAVEAFEGCALKRTATNTVFADGVAEGGVMLI